MRLLLVTRATPEMGSAAALRAVAVAEEWLSRGRACAWFSPPLPGWVRPAVAELNIPVFEADPRSTWREIAVQVREAAEQCQADALWLDCPQAPPAAWEALRAVRPLGAVSPDIGRPAPADWVAGPFDELTMQEEDRCLGARCYPVRRIVRDARPDEPRPAGPLRRVTVWLDGDSGMAAGMLARILDHACGDAARFTVPAAREAPYRSELEYLADMLSPRLEVIEPPVDPTALWRETDLAIVPPGAQFMEACAMGCATLAGFLRREDRALVQRHALSGAGLYYGSLKCTPSARAKQMLIELIDDDERRDKLAHRAHALIDGQGAARVVDGLEAWLKIR